MSDPCVACHWPLGEHEYPTHGEHKSLRIDLLRTQELLASERTRAASMRRALKQAMLIAEQKVDRGTLEASPWYREAKVILGVRDAVEDYPACKHCGIPGGH